MTFGPFRNSLSRDQLGTSGHFFGSRRKNLLQAKKTPIFWSFGGQTQSIVSTDKFFGYSRL